MRGCVKARRYCLMPSNSVGAPPYTDASVLQSTTYLSLCIRNPSDYKTAYPPNPKYQASYSLN